MRPCRCRRPARKRARADRQLRALLARPGWPAVAGTAGAAALAATRTALSRPLLTPALATRERRIASANRGPYPCLLRWRAVLRNTHQRVGAASSRVDRVSALAGKHERGARQTLACFSREWSHGTSLLNLRRQVYAEGLRIQSDERRRPCEPAACTRRSARMGRRHSQVDKKSGDL